MIAVYILEPWLRSRIVHIRHQIKGILVTFLVIAFCMDTLWHYSLPILNWSIDHGVRDSMRTITVLLTKYSDWISTFVYYISQGYTYASLSLDEDENTYYSFNYCGFCVKH